MKKSYIMLIVFSFLASIMLAQDSYEIKDLKMTGVETLSETKLKKNLILQEKSGWEKLLFWKRGDLFYQADLLYDKDLITNFYQKEGFLDVEVDANIKELTQEEAVEIEFVIKENDAVLIEDINYKLNISEPSDTIMTNELLKQFTVDLPLRKGSRFRDSDLIESQKQLGNWLAKQGYAYQEVDYNLQVRREVNKVIVNFDINTGPICYFGETTFVGVDQVPYSILKEQLDPPGKIYNDLYLEKVQNKIQGLGMFQYVTVREQLDEDESSKIIPIKIDLKEANRLSFKLGVGYGQEDKFRTSITVTKLGFLGGIRRAVFFAKYSFIEPYNLSLKVTQPALFHPQGSLIINPFAKKEDEENYTLSRIGSYVYYQIGIGNYFSSYLNYGLEWNKLKTASTSLEDDLIAEGKGNYRQTSATIGFIYDDSEPMFSAKKGWYFSTSFKLAGLGFNSDYHYTMTSADIRKYTEIFQQATFASRLKGGFMKSLRSAEDTPIADRFYAGGSSSVRGWSRFDLGPKSSDDLPMGGNSMLIGSLELRYPIWNRISGAIFSDAGNVWSGSYDHDLKEIEYAGGLGLRVETPLGPIRLDVAKSLSQPNKKIQFYLNIGEAF